jgi:pimeloyl-ACP methyl ester carboxylesterase
MIKSVLNSHRSFFRALARVSPLVVLALSCLGSSAAAAQEFAKKSFTSALDGQEEAYLYCLPAKTESESAKAQRGSGSIVLVYLHGLNGDETEPFKIPAGASLVSGVRKAYPNLALLSCPYGKGASWGTRLARIDITHNIQDFISFHPVDKIVIVGFAMGACTAANYAACAPSELRKKIAGIIVFSPVDNLAELYEQTVAPWLKTSLETAFGGKPSEKPTDYYINSLVANEPLFPSDAKVCVISPLQDTVFPIKLQKKFVRGLRNRETEVKVIEMPGDFQSPTAENIIEGLKFILP